MKCFVEVRTTTVTTNIYEVDEEVFKKEFDGDDVVKHGKWIETTKPTVYLHNVVRWKEEE